MIVGKYVETFAEGNMGMLEGASLNAPYPFHWVYIKSVEPRHIVCTGGTEEMRLPYRKTPRGDRAEVVIRDPIFGPLRFEVAPFQSDMQKGRA